MPLFILFQIYIATFFCRCCIEFPFQDWKVTSRRNTIFVQKTVIITFRNGAKPEFVTLDRNTQFFLFFRNCLKRVDCNLGFCNCGSRWTCSAQYLPEWQKFSLHRLEDFRGSPPPPKLFIESSDVVWLYIFSIYFACDGPLLFQAPKLAPELEFIKALIKIGKNLTRSPKDGRTVRLTADLGVMNINLPARVWLPLYWDTPHHVVRIPPHAAAVLNSKDKVGFVFGPFRKRSIKPSVLIYVCLCVGSFPSLRRGTSC